MKNITFFYSGLEQDPCEVMIKDNFLYTIFYCSVFMGIILNIIELNLTSK